MHRTSLMSAVSALALLAAAPVVAAELDWAGTLTGSYTHINPTAAGVPNANDWGIGGAGMIGVYDDLHLQLDGGYDRVNLSSVNVDMDAWNIGGAAFFGGDNGRFGLAAKYLTVNALGLSGESITYGAFGEFYADEMFTYALRGNMLAGDTHGYDLGGSVTAYLMPDFALRGDVNHTHINSFLNATSFTVDGEYLFSQEMPISAFAGYSYTTLSSGWDNAHTFFVGVKLYLNSRGSSLVERQRNGVVSTTNNKLNILPAILSPAVPPAPPVPPPPPPA